MDMQETFAEVNHFSVLVVEQMAWCYCGIFCIDKLMNNKAELTLDICIREKH